MFQGIKKIIAGIWLMAAVMVTAEVRADEPALSPVAQDVVKMSFLTESKPNLNADYFVFMQTSSWCAPCIRLKDFIYEHGRKIMAHPRMAFIYVSHDGSLHKARSVARENKVEDIPHVWVSEMEKLKSNPEYRGIPRFFILDKEGKCLFEGFASLLDRWKTYTIGEDDKSEAKSSPMEMILADCSYETSVRPNMKAEYFVLLQTASWCGPCNKEMPDTVRSYQEMKKDGRVELLVLGGDQGEGITSRWLKKFEAPFAVISLGKWPQLTKYNRGYPHAYVFDKNAKLIAHDGSWNIIPKWRSLTVKDTPPPANAAEIWKQYHKPTPKIDRQLKKLKYLTKKNPNIKARYYVFIASPFREDDIPALERLSDLYKDKDSKVEIILVALARNEDKKDIVSKSGRLRLNMPVVMLGDRNLYALPELPKGFTMYAGAVLNRANERVFPCEHEESNQNRPRPGNKPAFSFDKNLEAFIKEPRVQK